MMGENAVSPRQTVPPEVQTAVTAAEQEIVTLACEIDQLQRRITKLPASLDECLELRDPALQLVDLAGERHDLLLRCGHRRLHFRRDVCRGCHEPLAYRWT